MKLIVFLKNRISNIFLSLLSVFSSKFVHVYIDESICEKAGLATLTSIFIPQRKLTRITSDFYKIIKQIINKFPEKDGKGNKIVNLAPILHGNCLLVNSKENKMFDFSVIDDDFRIKIFNDIIDIVLKYRLHIIRCGYNNYNEIRKSYFRDDKMYSTNWLALSSYIGNSFKTRKAICIMDGNNIKMIRAFSQFIQGSKTWSYLYPETSKNLIIGNSKSFIGNVFYVPSKYCEFLQTVDIVAYILHKKDYIDITQDRSDFSNRIYDLHTRLKNKKVVNSIIKLKITPK